MDTQPVQHRDEDLLYCRRRVRSLRRSPYLLWPKEIHIETQTACNATCRFCPRGHLSRPDRRMPGDLFMKIVSDLAAIPSDLPFTIAPFWLNEPFLESRIFDFLQTINARLPGAWVRFSTNGIPLDEEKLAALRQVRNVKTLNVSVNEYSDGGRDELMGCSFQLLQERLRTIHDRKRRGVLPFDVTVSRVAGGSSRDEEFRRWAAENYPLFRCLVMPQLDWMGAVPMKTPPVPEAGCVNWFTMTVASDGTVPFCCLDAACRFPAGDVTKENLLRIYNRPEADALRLRAAGRTQADPCRHCSSLGIVSRGTLASV